jgi:teichuronic acid biosynthesis glycosyltransferase TuaG
MPRFSVLIPCYNCSNTLNNTLSSCLLQVFEDFEVILVDDCSVENVEGIYNKYLPHFKNKNISFKYYRNSINHGVSFSRNLAWFHSVGDYLCFLDSDDIWHESKLQVIDYFLFKNRIDCIYHDYTVNSLDFFSMRNNSDYRIIKLNKRTCLKKNPSQTSCFVINRNIQIRFDEKMRYSEDYDMWLKIIKKYSIYHLEGKPLTILSRPQNTPGGLSANRFKMRSGEIIAYINYFKSSALSFFLIPIFIFYSMLKHLISEIKLLCINLFSLKNN